MAEPISIQQLKNASEDAISLAEFIYKPSNFTVTRRLAPSINTLQYYIDSFNAVKATTDAYVTTIPNIVNDAINNTAVEGGILADTFVTVTANGDGAVARTLRDKNSDTVSVKDFGAKGNGIADDTTAFEQALLYAKSNVDGISIYVPSGTYRISRPLTVPSNTSLLGAGRGSTILSGVTKDFTGLSLNSGNILIRDLRVQGFKIGIHGTASARWSRVETCWLSYNTLGFHWDEGYINTICGCNISFNSYGGYITGESYQFNFYDNIVDNNLGGSGLIISGSCGVVIRDNTIEGNRNLSTGRGVGILYLAGIPQRMVIKNNWFEVNGALKLAGTEVVNEDSYDILLGLSNDIVDDPEAFFNDVAPVDIINFVRTISIAGIIHIEGNFHYGSAKAIAFRQQDSGATITICNEVFSTASRASIKPIYVHYESGMNAGKNEDIVSVSNCRIVNPPSMYSGGLYGFNHTPFVFTPTSKLYNLTNNHEQYRGLYQYNGKDVLVKEENSITLAEKEWARFDIPTSIAISGTLNYSKSSKLVGIKSNQGIEVLSGSRAIPNKAGSMAYFKGDEGIRYIGFIGSNDCLVTMNNNSITRTHRDGSIELNKVNTSTLINKYMMQTSGTLYGIVDLSEQEYEDYMKGALLLKITDFDKVSTKHYEASKTDLTSSYFTWTIGTQIYSSDPVATNCIGWEYVPTVGGTGIWQEFGT